MSRALISVDPSTTVFQVAKMMEQGGIGAVLVKKDGVPAGIITDRDYAIRVAVDRIAADTAVGRVASYPLIVIDGSKTLAEAAAEMTAKRIRKLAVVEGDEIIGIVTSTDLVAEMAGGRKGSLA